MLEYITRQVMEAFLTRQQRRMSTLQSMYVIPPDFLDEDLEANRVRAHAWALYVSMLELGFDRDTINGHMADVQERHKALGNLRLARA